MENKKTKLTISGKIKKPFNEFDTSKAQDKKTVVIDKKSDKYYAKTAVNKTNRVKQSFGFKKGTPSKNNFLSKAQPIASDFERRKLAEQRATKRLKGESDNEKKPSKDQKKES